MANMYSGIRAAWKELDNLPADEAKLQYIGLVKSACPEFQEAQAGKSKGGGPGGPVFSSLADGPEDSQTGPVSFSVPFISRSVVHNAHARYPPQMQLVRPT